MVHMKRQRMNNQKSRKLFSRTADNVKAINMRGAPMRGGIRL